MDFRSNSGSGKKNFFFRSEIFQIKKFFFGPRSMNLTEAGLFVPLGFMSNGSVVMEIK